MAEHRHRESLGRAEGTAGSLDTEEPAHDILAAEEFAVPTTDEFRHTGPVVLPEDPTGDAVPHDILAAEQFAMPAARPAPWAGQLGRRPGGTPRLIAELVAVAMLLVVLTRRRRHR